MSAAAADRRTRANVDRVSVGTYRIPTETPESDGTARWESTTLVLVEIDAGGVRGTGWSYASAAAATVIHETLAPLVSGADALDTRGLWQSMNGAVRNVERRGIASYAIAAVDIALWDLRARLHEMPLCDLMGAARETVAIYGSGGFTSYDERALQDQLGGWAQAGFRAVKMKVGRDHRRDVSRVVSARDAIGPDCELFVDGNGGYTVNEALAMAERFAELGVTWFEQPVDHRDLEGTRRVRDRAPAGMAIASGEYVNDTADAAAVASAVDVLQADATRCGGYTGLLAIDGFCEARRIPLSTHCAPALHLHAAAACLRLRHMEYFADHVRIEAMLFDGVVAPAAGRLRPDRSRPGHGLTFKHADAQRFAI